MKFPFPNDFIFYVFYYSNLEWLLMPLPRSNDDNTAMIHFWTFLCFLEYRTEREKNSWTRKVSFSNKISAIFFISLNWNFLHFSHHFCCFCAALHFIHSFLSLFSSFFISSTKSYHGMSQRTVARSILHGKRTNIQPSRRGANSTRSVLVTYGKFSCRIQKNVSQWTNWKLTSGAKLQWQQVKFTDTKLSFSMRIRSNFVTNDVSSFYYYSLKISFI